MHERLLIRTICHLLYRDKHDFPGSPLGFPVVLEKPLARARGGTEPSALHSLTSSELQSRFGDNQARNVVVCAKNGTAV